jgi:hypothetical protein
MAADMTKYTIESKAGGTIGEYEGTDYRTDLDAMARDAGYADYADLCAVTGGDESDLIIAGVA